jgi:hypothetical protein
MHDGKLPRGAVSVGVLGAHGRRSGPRFGKPAGRRCATPGWCAGPTTSPAPRMAVIQGRDNGCPEVRRRWTNYGSDYFGVYTPGHVYSVLMDQVTSFTS